MAGHDTPPRQRLLDEAIRLLGAHGPEALQARKVTAAAGTSTMAVYTHFGGMRELVEEIAVEGFRLLDSALAAVRPTRDPVADLAGLALVYRAWALDSPHLYRVMFGLAATGGHRLTGADLTAHATAESCIGQETFARLAEATRRAIAAGRFRDEDPTHTAAQLWSALHGYVLLEMSGYFGEPDSALEPVLIPLLRGLVIGLGDEPARVESSSARFAARFAHLLRPGARRR
ncbi:TetR/AcrR family transcriptional regulator [Streptomyces sp. O3]